MVVNLFKAADHVEFSSRLRSNSADQMPHSGLHSVTHGSLRRKARRRRGGLDHHRPHQCVCRTLYSLSNSLFLVTPFDVVKTRLQTQPSRPRLQLLFPDTCCQPIQSAPCVRKPLPFIRSMSSLAPSYPGEVVCIWKNGVFKTEQVNGFYDAVRHVWRAEGLRGLWKGAGTSLCVIISDFLVCCDDSDK